MKKFGIICAMWVEAQLLHDRMEEVRETEYSGMKYYEGRIENADVVLCTCGVGIICAMWVEAQLLHDRMEEVRETEYSGMKYYEGRIENADVVLCTCGVGKVNAALYTQILIDRFGVDAIVHTGIAGSMDETVRHLDVVVADGLRFGVDAIVHTGIAGSMDETVRHLDVVVADGLTYYDVRKEQLRWCFPNQTAFFADKKIRDTLVECAGEDVRRGLILTGDGFVSDCRQKDALKREFPDALCVEMEGCAVAHTAFVNGVSFGVIRCISDLADGAADEDYKEFEEKAAYKAAEIVKKTVAALSKTPDISKAGADNAVTIRMAVPEDAEALLKIYAPYVEKTAVTFEYEVPSAAEFSDRIKRTLKKYPYLAAEQDGEVVGYAYAGTFHERAAYDWAVETSIYVREDKKGSGIGRALYSALEHSLLRQNILNVNACIAYPAHWAVETSIYVREDKKGSGIGRALYSALEHSLLRQNILNVNACIAYPAREDEYLTKDSVRFHEKLGYRMAGRFHQCGYKFGRWYDMVWMEKHLGSHPENPEKVIWRSEEALL